MPQLPLFRFIKKRLKKYILRLNGTNLNLQYVFFGYERYWIPSLEFEAPVLTISNEGSILSPRHKDLLQKLKVMRTFPLVMRSTPAEIGGIDLRSLEITCDVQAMHHLVALFTSYIPTKLLLITAIEFHQLEIGIKNLFLSSSFSKLSNIATSTWVTNLWEFLHLYRLELYLPSLDLPFSSCGNDVALVDFLINSIWKDEKLRLANQNRVHLKAYFISDLLIPGSNKIKRCFIQGLTDEYTFSTHDWTVAQTNKDSAADWKMRYRVFAMVMAR